MNIYSNGKCSLKIKKTKSNASIRGEKGDISEEFCKSLDFHGWDSHLHSLLSYFASDGLGRFL